MFARPSLTPMKRLTPTQEEYRKVAELFLWATQRDFTQWFTGEAKPWKRTQYNLPRMVRKGALTAVRYGKKLVYSTGKKRAGNTADIEHGLICTESLLRFKSARVGDFIPESFFRTINLGCVPEWGVIYGNTLVVYEYCTFDNFRRTRLMKKKVNTYRKSKAKFETYFDKNLIVLFVFETFRYSVINFVEKNGNGSFIYFCDLRTFMSVDAGKQLTSNIYLNGADCVSYPLTK